MNTRALTQPARALPEVMDTTRLVEAFLAGRNAQTMRAYRQDLRDFRATIGAESLDEAAGLLLRGHGMANALALAYKAKMQERGLSAATINRRLAALRSLVKLARTLGIIGWEIDIKNVRVESYRDTRGPASSALSHLLARLRRMRGEKAARDYAMLRLLFDLGLRRGEVVSLDTRDVDLKNDRLAVVGKGRTEKILLTLPEQTKDALKLWLNVRGTAKGPLFTSFHHGCRGSRLTGTSLYRIVKELGRWEGIELRPHGIRHAAITEALNLTNGDVRAVQRFSRHRDLRTLNVYDDNRQDLGGEVARKLAELL